MFEIAVTTLLTRFQSWFGKLAGVINSFSFHLGLFFSLLIRNGDNISNTNKLQLLHRTLDLLTGSLITDHDARRREFNGLPFLRIFVTMIKDLCQHDAALEQFHWNILETFGYAFLIFFAEIQYSLRSDMLCTTFNREESRLSHSIGLKLLVIEYL